VLKERGIVLSEFELADMYEVHEEGSTPLLPRERMDHFGPKMLSNQELLAIILRTGTKKENVMMLSQKVFDSYATLFDLKQTSLEDLKKISGIGEVKAGQIIALIELGRRIHLANQDLGDTVRSSYSLAHRLIQETKDYTQEHLIVLFLNTKNKIIRQKTLFIGSLNQSVCHPREIFRDAVRFSAASVILAHNHPSGNQSPSNEDREITKRVYESGKMMGIELLDHLVLGSEDYYSFREEGKLAG
jgi:DNA repair protein RadC